MMSDEDEFYLDQVVRVCGKGILGTVRYIGTASFAPGKWIGLVLNEKKGRNDGSVQGERYFECEDGYGLFVKKSFVVPYDGENVSKLEGTPASSESITEKTPKSRLERKPSKSGSASSKRRIEPTSLKRKTVGNNVPQKPDHLRIPMLGKFSVGCRLSFADDCVYDCSSSRPALSKVKSSSVDKGQSLFNDRKQKTASTGSPSLNRNKPEDLQGVMKVTSSKKIAAPKLPLASSPATSKFSPVRGTDRGLLRGNKESSPQSSKKISSFTEDKEIPSTEAFAQVMGKYKDSPLTTNSSSPQNEQTGFIETLTAQYTPGAPSGAMQTLEDKMNAIQLQQQIESLNEDNKDLSEKLETLKVKRAQDKEKLKEGEKYRMQVEQLVEFKVKIMEVQGELQKDLKRAKQETEDVLESKQRYIEETEELYENVEMLTLDKEMAEEKGEALQLELEQALETIEELKLDLETLNEEKGLVENDTTKSTSSVQIKQLEQQNIRMKDTLVKMRDIAARDKHDIQRLQKEVEEYKLEIVDATKSKEKLLSKVDELQHVIAELQEQVDTALGAEDMVETLTDRNLNLEEKVSELLETVSDLEAINDMNDQLQEDARELELDLREELDMANMKTQEVLREKDALNEVIVDQDNTIKKFRELVQKIQEQNEELRHALERETNKPVVTPSEIIDFKKMFTETKAHGKAIEMELRKLEVQQANQHVSYLLQYLPDDFMSRGGDHEAVLTLLLLPRLICKVNIISNCLREKYTSPSEITISAILKSHTVDQYSFSCRFLQLICTLQIFLHQYQHILQTCPVEVFLKLGALYSEIIAYEKNIDYYVDLLRKDQLDENAQMEYLDKVVNYFLNVFQAHLENAKFNLSLFIADVCKTVSSAAELATTEVSRIKAFLKTTPNESEISLLCRDVLSSSLEILSAIKKIRRRMPQDGLVSSRTYNEEVKETLLYIVMQMNLACRTLKHISKAIMMQVTLTCVPDANGASLPEEKIKEFIHQATDIIYGSDDLGPEFIRLSFSRTMLEITKMATEIEKGEYDFDGNVNEKVYAPVSLRAKIKQSEMKDTEHLKYKLESKEQDVRELKLAIKQKNEEISELVVRRDMAEKKLVNATKDSDMTIEKLQRKLDDTVMMLRRKEKEFDEAMDVLQNDIDSLESERGELKERLRTQQSKRALYEAYSRSSSICLSPSSPTAPASGVFNPPASGTVVKESPLLLQQINDLKKALQHAVNVNNSLKSDKIHRQLASLKPIKVIKASIFNEEKKDVGKEDEENKLSDQITSLSRKVVQLKKEMHKTIMDLEVVDLTKHRPGSLPITTTRAPVFHLVSQKNKINNLQSQINILQDEINRLILSVSVSGCVSSAFSAFPTPQLSKIHNEKDLVRIGRISIASKEDVKESVSLVLQPQHLKQLYMKLLC